MIMKMHQPGSRVKTRNGNLGQIRRKSVDKQFQGEAARIPQVPNSHGRYIQDGRAEYVEAPSGEDQTIGTKSENNIPIIGEIVEVHQGQGKWGGTSQ